MRQRPDSNNAYFRPVIPLLFALITGLVTGSAFPGHALAAACITLSSLLLILCVIRRNVVTRFSPLALFAGLGYLSLQFWVAPHFPPNHVVHYLDGASWSVEGTVSDDPVTRNRRTYLYLAVHSLAGNGTSRSVSGKIRVTIMGKTRPVKRGDVISFKSRIRSIRNFHNFGGFDYERYMAFRRIYGSAYARADRLAILSCAEISGAAARIDRIRRDMGRLIEKSGSPKASAVLKALVVGDRAGMSSDIRNAFNRLGLGHLLAISGLHIGIVATLAFFIFRQGFSLVPVLRDRGRVRKAAAAAALLPVLTYGMISGMSPSTQRAVIMVGVFLAAFWFERESDPLNTLAVAAMAILIISPPSLFSVSFQLSFAAVLAILLGLKRIHQHFPATGFTVFSWRNRFIIFLSVSLLATLGTLPLLMAYFNQLSFVGIPANCVAVPLFGFLVVPLGLVSAFIFPFSEPLAAMGFQLASAVLNPVLELFLNLSQPDFICAKTVSPNFIETCCYYLIFVGIIYFRKRRWPKIILAAAMFVLALDAAYWTHRRWFSNEFKVTALDVGQGSAALLEFPRGYTMMIDGGGFSDNSVFDVGERIVAPYLLRNKIKTVDTLVLTHPNADHLNGLIYIADNFNVSTVWTNGEPADTRGFKSLMDTIRENSIQLPEFSSLPRNRTINRVELSILHPPADFNPESVFSRLNGTNDNSIVIRARFGKTAFLFPGDITTTAELKISSSNENVAADVLVSPHHGSKSSSSMGFLKRVHPEAVIISAGWKNRFRFPHPSVLSRYRRLGCRVFRTDLHGAVIAVSDGRRLVFDTCLPARENDVPMIQKRTFPH